MTARALLLAITPPAAPSGGTGPVVFRSLASLTYTSRTNSTVTAPSGIANGDILFAIVVTAAASSAPTPTPPAGFSSFGTATSVSDSGSFNGKMNLFWKRASGESGSYTFTHTACSSQVVLSAYSGCLASGTPLGATSNANGTDTISTGTSITTTNTNSRLLYCAHNWTAAIGAATPPTGMTERFDQLTYLADEAIASIGATGSRVGSPNGNTGSNELWVVRMVELLAS